MNNVACSRLGTILHPGTQNIKEATKTLEFKNYLRGTAACMKIIYMATKGSDQLTSNDTQFYDGWFSSIKTAEEAMDAEVNYCGPEKTIHKGFCLAILEKLTKDFPRGSYIAMKITPIVPGGIPLLVIG